MNIKNTVFILFLSLIFSCTPKAVKGEMPPQLKMKQENTEKQAELIQKIKDPDPYRLNFEIFRYNQLSLIDKAYENADPDFLSALSNEFMVYTMDKKDYLMIALNKYADILQKTPQNTNSFILQRVGVVYYKLNQKDKANKFLSRALLDQQENDELFYYRALLAAYYSRNFQTAAWYLKRINLKESLFPAQDILYFIGKMEEEQKNYGGAERYYMDALNVSPSRFYILYDLVPFYQKWDRVESAVGYTEAAFSYLTSLSNAQLSMKAYRQKLELNRALLKDTYYHSFNIPAPYTYYPHLYYFMTSPYFASKSYASGLVLPINEQKNSRSDILMYLTYEELEDTLKNTGIVIIGGGLSITNFRYENKKLYTPVDKHFFYTNVISFISPTNQIFTITNFARPTNHPQYITTNIENSLYKSTLDFDYFLSADKFDMNRDKQWETLAFGIKSTNSIGMSIFYPALKKTESFTLPIRRHDAELYIQDLDNDGKNEIYLLDKGVKIIKQNSVVK